MTLLKEHQFDVLNVDLIYGIPGQMAASSPIFSGEGIVLFARRNLYLSAVYSKGDMDASAGAKAK